MRKHYTTISVVCLGLATTFGACAQEVTNEMGTGLIPLSDEEYDALEERDPLLRGALPEFVDLSSFFPDPGHQGAQGSCVGWAVGYALKTYQEAKETRAVRPAEDRHFSPSFVFNSIKVGDDCNAGSRITDALEFIQTTGAVSMYDFPYVEEECPAPPEDLLDRGEDYQIKSFNRLERGDLFAIQEALSNEKPVVAGMYVYPSFQTWNGDGIYEHSPDTERRKDYHAVTIVGYDDEREAIRLINSWGTGWGDEGYAWVSYDAAEKLIREAYVTTDNNLFGDFNSIDPDQVYAVLSGESSDSMAGSSSPETPPAPVTESMLETAVTGHVGRDSEGRTPSGYDFYPASVWLTLEEPQLEQIESVEYYFYHSTFSNPMRPVSDSNVFLATWKGYGCIENAEVQVTLKTGETLSAPFSLCRIWDRFHPGAFRKDGTSSGTNPLRSEDAFSKRDPT
ncbi:MAG: C1 family peptidase [Pseudomonadota bacterium]